MSWGYAYGIRFAPREAWEGMRCSQLAVVREATGDRGKTNFGGKDMTGVSAPDQTKVVNHGFEFQI